MISAEIICDSISPQGKRLTTFKLRYPKFIHGEFMTHRVISRNASSSRAIPTKKLLEEVRSDALRAAPVFWGKNQAGMQAAEELYGFELMMAQKNWEAAALECAKLAEGMAALGAHKQIVNRLLEPFSHINVIATATEWDNFFGLRLHKDAQPEMRALAVAMWESRQASEPLHLSPGEWHLPFVPFTDMKEAQAQDNHFESNALISFFIKVSVARCARVSYESFETGKRSTDEEDIKLYERLTAGLRDHTQPLHASPMEHQAMPDFYADDFDRTWATPKEHGNFVGWRQYRKMLPNESVAPLPEGF